jgi:ribosome recycling factor
MSADDILLDCEDRMDKALSNYKEQLRGLRTGRASPAMVDSLRVEYYGSPTPLKQLAQISTPEPQQILIKPYNAGDLKEIEKAIRSSDLGLTPSSDGKLIRLTVPPMSGEQRKKLEKHVKEEAEKAKVSCRNVRRDANKDLEKSQKDGNLTEDQLETAKEQVQELLKDHESKISELAEKKIKEILEQ